MKKTILALFILFTALSAFAQTATIREVSGTVELKAAGAADFTTARAGDVVREDTVISTAFRSTAIIETGSTRLTVQPLTRLSLSEIRAAAGTETLNVNLQAGRVRVDVNPPAGTRASMTVTSPSATASVRGTSFIIDVRNLHVLNGQVTFGGLRGLMMIFDAGNTGHIGSDGAVIDPLITMLTDLLPSVPVGTDPFSGTQAVVQDGILVVEDTTGTIIVSVDYSNL